MTDPDENQSTSGSWQPDPTGRYKLRWRNEAGDWTRHVYNDDGELGSDAYDSPSEPHPPPGPSEPSEPPGAQRSEEFQPSDPGPRAVVCGRCGHTDFVVKRDRVLWHVCFWLGLWLALPFLRKLPYCARCGLRGSWLSPTGAALAYEDKPKPPVYRRWWAFVLYGFVVLVVIANLVDDAEEESGESAPSAEREPPESDTALVQAPTTTSAATAASTTTARQATTTVRQATTTQPPASTEEDCGVRSSLLSLLGGEVGALFEDLSLQAAIGDIVGMQETYGTIAWAMADLPDMTRETIEICRPHVPQSVLDDIELSLAVAEAGWYEVQRACQSDLAPLGFDCDTGTMSDSSDAVTDSGADASAASELTARERTCADNWDGISYSEMLRMKRDRSIDGIYDWSGGYWVSYEKIMDIC